MDAEAVPSAAEAVTADMLITGTLSGLPDDPAERAQIRLARLRTTFAASLAIVAEMHRDQDWKHLTREDGTPYSSLAEVMVDVFNVSASMARRYVQGARDFYLPLSELTVEGTRIEITSGDVAKLGKAGITDVVATAKERLEGVEDADEASEIITASLSEAKSRKSGSGSGMDAPESSTARDLPDPSPMPRDRPTRDLVDDLPDDEDDPLFNDTHSSASGPVYTGLEDEDEDIPASGRDAVERIMAGAHVYDADEADRALADPLKGVFEALQALAKMDPVEVASMIDYDNRGVLSPVEDALTHIKRLRSSVEASPWVIARLAQ